jgi:hypothetical protein
MFKKKGLFLVIFLPISTLTSSEKNYNSYIIGTAAALFLGKLTYNYFNSHYIAPEQTIEQHQSTFKIIQSDIQYYYKLYRNDAQMSNWELKEMILDCNSKNQYPFLEYYTSLQQALLLLQKHRVIITTHINKIQLLKLKQEGKDLENQISKIISLIIILRMRIQMFKEYHEDCYYSNEKMSNS